jgi:hypothetical protein
VLSASPFIFNPHPLPTGRLRNIFTPNDPLQNISPHNIPIIHSNDIYS